MPLSKARPGKSWNFLKPWSRPFDSKKEVKKSEKNIVETCAGKEYAKLSDEVRDKIIDSVGEPVTEIIENLVVSCYLREKWNPEYEVDDNDR